MTRIYTDPKNSTDTVLGSSETFTGTWTRVDEYESVVIVAKSDVDGTLYADFYFDPGDSKTAPTSGTTPDSSIPYNVEGGTTEPPHQLIIARGWYRTRFINGATAQSSLQVITRYGVPGLVVSPANLSVAQNSDAIVTREVSEELDIAKGKRRGHIFIRKFGHNTDVDAGGTDIGYGLTGAYTGFPTASPENFEVISSSVNDTAAGSGARTVRLYYLDDNYNQATVDVTLNGTTGVDSGVSGMRCWRAEVLTSGSSNNAFNDGTITIRWITTTSVVFAMIEPGVNQTESATYTIPAGYTGYLKKFRVYMDKTASASGTVVIYERPFGASPKLKYETSITQSAPIEPYWYGFTSFAEKTDIALRVETISTTNVEFTGSFDLILVKNS